MRYACPTIYAIDQKTNSINKMVNHRSYKDRQAQDSEDNVTSVCSRIIKWLELLGIVGSTVTAIFMLGYGIGCWKTKIEYEQKLRNEKAVLEVNHMQQLREEERKWARDYQNQISMEELKQFIEAFKKYQEEKK